MIRTLLFIFASMLAFTTPNAFGKHTCDSAFYTKVMPKHQGLYFGMKSKDAVEALKKQFKNRAVIDLSSDGVMAKLHSAHRDLFDFVYLATTNGVVTSFAWSYSDAFQTKLGGPSNAVVSITSKLKERVGTASSYGKHEGGFKIDWPDRDGLSLRLFAKDPSTIVLRFSCSTLIDSENEKLRNSVNMGF